MEYVLVLIEIPEDGNADNIVHQIGKTHMVDTSWTLDAADAELMKRDLELGQE